MAGKKYARVDTQRCVSCGECARVCPTGAMTIYRGCYAQAAKNKCVGCGLCVHNCPAGCLRLEVVA